MIHRNMIIDIDHMSQYSRNDTLDICTAAGYSGVISGHNGFLEISHGNKNHEGNISGADVERIRQLGGMICPLLGQGNLETTDTWHGIGPTKIDHINGNTTNSLVQAYLYAAEKMQGLPVGFGSDLNGFAQQPGPRFAPHNGTPNETPPRPTTRLRYPFRAAATGKMMSRSVVGSKAFDFNRDGLAHVGMLPDLIADLQAMGLTETDLLPLLKSATGYAQLWKKAGALLAGQFYYLSYKSADGSATIDRIQPDGQGSDTIWNATWTTGWTHFMPFQLADQSYYLSYKSADGSATIDRIQPDGQGSDTIWNATWTTGWTHFMPFQLADQSYYLSYKSADGSATIDRIQPDGQGSDTIWNATWTTGWTHFMPFQLADQSYYLSYKSADGSATIDRIQPDGQGSDTIWNATWTTGWTHFMPFQLADQSYYLSYKSADGSATIDRIQPDGQGSDTIWNATWTTGWTHFMPFQLADQSYYLSYKSADGSATIDRIQPDGQGSDTIWNATWTTGWTHFMPFQLAG